MTGSASLALTSLKDSEAGVASSGASSTGWMGLILTTFRSKMATGVKCREKKKPTNIKHRKQNQNTDTLLN